MNGRVLSSERQRVGGSVGMRKSKQEECGNQIDENDNTHDSSVNNDGATMRKYIVNVVVLNNDAFGNHQDHQVDTRSFGQHEDECQYADLSGRLHEQHVCIVGMFWSVTRNSVHELAGELHVMLFHRSSGGSGLRCHLFPLPAEGSLTEHAKQ